MNDPVSTPSAPPSKIQRVHVGIAVALVLGAIFYGVGLSQGRAQLAAQRTESDGQIQRLQAQVDSGKQQVAAAQNRTHLDQARANLYRTALDLERRNFGTANTHLQESAAMLDRVQGSGNLDMARLGALKENLAKTDINVATDLEGQRKRVLDFAGLLENLTPGQPGQNR
ncbi:MAG: hypothetical protein WKF55_01150 [Gemmatimonadaceae bacterium]